MDDKEFIKNLRATARALIGEPVVQTTVAAPYATTSRVERLSEELAELNSRFDGALAQGASEVANLKNEIAELRRELNLAIARGDEQIKALSNRIDYLWKVKDKHHKALSNRIEQLEDTVNWHEGANMENATAPASASATYGGNVRVVVGSGGGSGSHPNLSITPTKNDLVITHEWKSPEKARPTEHLQIEVLTANNKRNFYFSPDDIDFSPTAFDPVIAWRYSERT